MIAKNLEKNYLNPYLNFVKRLINFNFFRFWDDQICSHFFENFSETAICIFYVGKRIVFEKKAH